MNEGLTARQTQILKAMVDEYIDTAEPVGSESLEKKYNLGVSPATIRNEMVSLAKAGYLKQPHTSAGRIPTPKSMKFYIEQLMEEKQMSLADEVRVKEEIWDARGDFEDLLEEAVHSLAERTNTLAVATTEGGGVWHSGYANVFSDPVFSDLAVCASVFGLLEQEGRVHELFFEKIHGDSPIEIIFGEELGWEGFSPIGVVATRFKLKDREGALGVIGPTRLSYSTVIPVLRYFGSLIEEIGTA